MEIFKKQNLTTMGGKRIFVYCEDAPVDRNVVAHGLHRAATPILRSVRDHIEGIAIYPIGLRFPDCDFDQELLHLCASLPLIPTILCKILRRYPALGMKIAEELPARLLAPVVKRSRADTLFCFVGADIGTLMRAVRLAALAGKAYAFYVVDDFISPLRLAGMPEFAVQNAAEQARMVLRGASHVFTITDGLGELLRNNYGVSSTTLSLAFEPEPRLMLPAKNQIIYVGSINFLYADGLHDLFKAVERVRRTSSTDLTVRLTVHAKAATRELGELPPFVVSAPVENSEGLAREIASSLFAFLPSSFDLPQKTMVATSFPSKSLEYLAYARSIVVYGPEYGVTTKRFLEANLPYVVSSPIELEEIVRAHLSIQPEYSAMYSKYLAATHSLTGSRKTLCAGLGLEEL